MSKGLIASLIYSIFHMIEIRGSPRLQLCFLNFLPLENKTMLSLFRSSQMVGSRTSKRFLATDLDILLLRRDVHGDVHMCSMVIMSGIYHIDSTLFGDNVNNVESRIDRFPTNMMIMFRDMSKGIQFSAEIYDRSFCLWAA